MLKGIDISHYNKNMKQISDINDFDFVIMKATEGVTYKDPALPTYINYLHDDTLRGFYHFARPDNKNSAQMEASFFLSTILKYMQKPCIIALDVEGKALDQPYIDDWCLEWCRYIYNAVGIKPLIYTGYSFLSKFKKCAAYDCGLWLAKWGKRPETVAPWKFFAIWQYTSDGKVSGVRTDLDYFNGTKEQFLKYCERR